MTRAQPDPRRGRGARRAARRRALRHRRRPERPARGRGAGPRPRTITFTCAGPVRAPSSTAWPTSVARPSTASTLDLADGRGRPDPAARPRGRQRAGGRGRRRPTPAAASGILRTVDPSDKLVYVWTSFEPDEARRVWACFDQPDLKAPHAFTVTGPGRVDGHQQLRARRRRSRSADADGGRRRWTLPRHAAALDVRRRGQRRPVPRDAPRGRRLRPRPLLPPVARSYLERDADELFDAHRAPGLAFFGERFGQPFPQERYDQVFVPNMGGAMENWGCVTWTDGVLFRTPADPRPARGASPRSCCTRWRTCGSATWSRCAGGTTSGSTRRSPRGPPTGRPSTPPSSPTPGRRFLAGLKIERLPRWTWARPPTRSAATCPTSRRRWPTSTRSPTSRAQSVLKQLVAYVGEEAFVEGLRAYFREHAWGNTASTT